MRDSFSDKLFFCFRTKDCILQRMMLCSTYGIGPCSNAYDMERTWERLALKYIFGPPPTCWRLSRFPVAVLFLALFMYHQGNRSCFGMYFSKLKLLFCSLRLGGTKLLMLYFSRCTIGNNVLVVTETAGVFVT